MPSDSKEWRIHFLSATVLFLVITKEARFFKCVSLRNLFTAEYEAVGRSAFQQIMEIVAFKDSLGNVSKSTSARCTLNIFVPVRRNPCRSLEVARRLDLQLKPVVDLMS